MKNWLKAILYVVGTIILIPLVLVTFCFLIWIIGSFLNFCFMNYPYYSIFVFLFSGLGFIIYAVKSELDWNDYIRKIETKNER